jgi:hypothetical protein
MTAGHARPMNIVVNAELKAYIDPLTAEEHEALERSLLADGCRDALVLWGDVLVDGHNRYGICQQHSLPFKTVQHPRFQSIDDVCLWMIDQHLGRRSVSNFQRGLLALRKSDILARQHAAAMNAPDSLNSRETRHEPGQPGATDDPTAPAAPAAPERLQGREAIAKAAKLSGNQMVMIERIQKQAAPEVVAAVRAGTISINAGAALATLPADAQVAAAAAGADELKQAARRVRESKRKPGGDPSSSADDPDMASIPALRQRIAELTAENAALRSRLAALQPAVG